MIAGFHRSFLIDEVTNFSLPTIFQSTKRVDMRFTAKRLQDGSHGSRSAPVDCIRTRVSTPKAVAHPTPYFCDPFWVAASLFDEKPQMRCAIQGYLL